MAKSVFIQERCIGKMQPGLTIASITEEFEEEGYSWAAAGFREELHALRCGRSLGREQEVRDSMEGRRKTSVLVWPQLGLHGAED